MILAVTWHSRKLYTRKLYIRRNYKKARQSEKRDKKLKFKNYATFTGCAIQRNNPELHNIKDVDSMKLMENLIE